MPAFGILPSGVRFIASLLFILCFVAIATANWIILIRCMREKKHYSLIFLIGGFAGLVGFALSPFPAIRTYRWLPLIVDWGTLPSLLLACVFRLLARRSREQERAVRRRVSKSSGATAVTDRPAYFSLIESAWGPHVDWCEMSPIGTDPTRP